MALPWLPEGTTSLATDSPQRSLWKIVDLASGGGGSGTGGAGSIGVGSPEGVLTASPGTTYGTAAGGFWYKVTGTGNTGWIQLVAE